MDCYNKDLQLPFMSNNFPIIDNNIFLIYKKQNPNLNLKLKKLQSKYKIQSKLKSNQFEFNFEYEKNRIDDMFKINLYYDLPIHYIDYIMMKQIQSL